MDEAPNIYPNLNDQQFRLNKINEVKDYFKAEIRERQLTSKRHSKYITSFDYLTSGGISIASFVTVIEIPVGIASANLSFAFSITTVIVKKC